MLCPLPNRLKRLNTQTVKRGGTVQKNGVLFDYTFENVPNFGSNTLYHTLCALYVVAVAFGNKAFHYKRLEKFKSHFLRQTALVNFEFGAYNDNRTSRIVNTLTEKVLTETSLLTFEHIGKRF